jgi:hypothetical protein
MPECFNCEKYFELTERYNGCCSAECAAVLQEAITGSIEDAKRIGIIDSCGNAIISEVSLPESKAKQILEQFHLRVGVK